MNVGERIVKYCIESLMRPGGDPRRWAVSLLIQGILIYLIVFQLMPLFDRFYL
tara:strand:- start:12 stop:170 length:159 start_codon:yes stop_codon:yes gene_type:complete